MQRNRVSVVVVAAAVVSLSLPLHAAAKREGHRLEPRTPSQIVRVIKKVFGLKTDGDSVIPPIPVAPPKP